MRTAGRDPIRSSVTGERVPRAPVGTATHTMGPSRPVFALTIGYKPTPYAHGSHGTLAHRCMSPAAFKAASMIGPGNTGEPGGWILFSGAGSPAALKAS